MASNTGASDNNDSTNVTKSTRNKDKKQKKTLPDSKLSEVSKASSSFFQAKMMKSSPSYWDPLSSFDWDIAGSPTFFASSRIKRDLSYLFSEPLPGIFIIPDESNFCIVHALILGPIDTPYEAGFFHFIVRFGPSYPIHPPRIRFMTTNGGKVRFNPNLYADGKVCLSILGTWSGPKWSPAQNLGSVLLSIQSILNENPFFNEPGFSSERYQGESEAYNVFIKHEVIRVSVCNQIREILDAPPTSLVSRLPEDLAVVIKDLFVEFYDCYVEICNKYKHLDGQEVGNIFHPPSGTPKRTYSFAILLIRLAELKERISATEASGVEKDRDGSLSSLSDDDSKTTRKEQNENPTGTSDTPPEEEETTVTEALCSSPFDETLLFSEDEGYDDDKVGEAEKEGIQ